MQRCVRVSSEQLTSYREQMPARESAQPPLHLCKTQAERWGREHLGTIATVCAVLPGNQVHELSTEGTPHPAQQRGAGHQGTWSMCWGSLACRAQPEHYCDRKSSVLSSLNKLFLQIKNEKPSSSHSSFLHYSSSGAAGRDSTRVGGAEVAALLGTPGQLVGRCQGSPGEGSILQMQRAQEQGTSRDFAEAAGVQHLLGMGLWDRAGGSRATQGSLGWCWACSCCGAGGWEVKETKEETKR